jgi:beta-N-acetylhexosaminidase
VIFGCAGGATLDADQRSFFREANPLGFILFDYNCEGSGQIAALVAELREAVGRADAPVLIDQEGGRVARLKPPEWRAAPPAARFGELATRDPQAGLEAARLNARLIAHDLQALGINVDCAPVVDVPAADGHDVIGDRALSSDPTLVGALGRAVCEGFLAGGVLPVLKHMPGHGRARADSHHDLPLIAASRAELGRTDFAPFKALADMPWAMTAHVVLEAVDANAPATISATVIEQVIRGDIGFEGVLIADDLGMEALDGGLAERARAVLDAGCDLVLQCSGQLADMVEVAEAVAPLSAASASRVARAQAMLRLPEELDVAAALTRLEHLLAEG